MQNEINCSVSSSVFRQIFRCKIWPEIHERSVLIVFFGSGIVHEWSRWHSGKGSRYLCLMKQTQLQLVSEKAFDTSETVSALKSVVWLALAPNADGPTTRVCCVYITRKQNLALSVHFDHLPRHLDCRLKWFSTDLGSPVFYIYKSAKFILSCTIFIHWRLLPLRLRFHWLIWRRNWPSLVLCPGQRKSSPRCWWRKSRAGCRHSSSGSHTSPEMGEWFLLTCLMKREILCVKWSSLSFYWESVEFVSAFVFFFWKKSKRQISSSTLKLPKNIAKWSHYDLEFCI